VAASLGSSLEDRPGELAASGGWFRRIGLRRVRLSCGLVLFTYVSTHLLNHSLGNISVEAMEAGLAVQKVLWQGYVGTLALYTALVTHFALGLWAFYERRHYGWTRAEILQALLGASIPPLLINHLLVTRIDLLIYGTEKGYAQELYSFWVASPLLGWIQVTVLIVAWTHGCIGLYFWLRLKPLFSRWGPVLLALALIVPMLALLGYYQGGRTVTLLAADPAWRAVNLVPHLAGTPGESAALAAQRSRLLLLYGVMLGLILAARGLRAWLERRHGSFRLSYPNGRTLVVPHGFSVLEASLMGRVPHACVCGGRARCSTCRIRICGECPNLPPPSPVERAVLQRCGAGPSVRLACQLRPATDLAIVPLLPPTTRAADIRNPAHPMIGEERFVVVMVVDMRDSTGLAEQKMPFDTVFVIDRFIDVVGHAISEAGGRPNQFIGDGLLAMFGVDCDPEPACRRALQAAVAIGAAVEALNRSLAADLERPIRFGIGIHGGSAVVGEIGYGSNRVLTALGDPANVASRLEAQCKTFGAEVVVSDETCRTGGVSAHDLPLAVVEMRGRVARVAVRIATHAADLAPLTPAGQAAARPT